MIPDDSFNKTHNVFIWIVCVICSGPRLCVQKESPEHVLLLNVSTCLYYDMENNDEETGEENRSA